MSVDAECLMLAEGVGWNFSLRAHTNYFLVRLAAGFARQQQQTVEHKPVNENRFHTEVIGRKSSPICNALRDAVEWVVKPDGV